MAGSTGAQSRRLSQKSQITTKNHLRLFVFFYSGGDDARSCYDASRLRPSEHQTNQRLRKPTHRSAQERQEEVGQSSSRVETSRASFMSHDCPSFLPFHRLVASDS